MSLKGTLSELALSDLVEVISLGGKTGRLEIADLQGEQAGALSFKGGRLINAGVGALRGERAFYAALALRDGSFFFDTEADPGEESFDLPTGSLLMEGMRRVDEAFRLRAALPATSRAVFVGGESNDPVEKSILGYLGPGTRDVGDIVAGMLLEGVADEYDSLRALSRLVERGVVRMSASGTEPGPTLPASGPPAATQEP
ncbi:MAG TPA: DUF4388 domain-containing protein [Thermoleophilia bacterium]|nr:DUF4388 domain-containing protein [Thermoleophilia bacterium]